MAQQATYTENISYRRLDENDDYVMGVQGELLTGVEAMAQALKTRLRVVLGEWWEGDNTALPYFPSILGKKNVSREALDLKVIARIMDTVGVLSVSNIKSSMTGRNYSFSCTVKTVYGETTAEVAV